MRRLLTAGLLMVSMGAMAAPLPADSPWLVDNAYIDIVTTNSGKLVAVGDRGSVLLSDDKGKHWQLAKTPVDVLLTGVCFANDKVGWAVGHDAAVIKTTDGGLNWALQYADPLDGEPVGVHDEDDDVDFDYDDYDDNYFPPDRSGAPLLDVWCDPEDQQHALAVGGYGYLLETSSGGDVWRQKHDRVDNADGWNLYSIDTTSNDRTVVISGEKGSLFMSTDNGKHFERIASPYEGSFFGALANQKNDLLVFGLKGNLWTLRHDSNKWTPVTAHTASSINQGIAQEDGTILLVGDDGNVLLSYDDGATFRRHVVLDRTSLTAGLLLDNGRIVVTSVKGIHLMKLKRGDK